MKLANTCRGCTGRVWLRHRSCNDCLATSFICPSRALLIEVKLTSSNPEAATRRRGKPASRGCRPSYYLTFLNFPLPFSFLAALVEFLRAIVPNEARVSAGRLTMATMSGVGEDKRRTGSSTSNCTSKACIIVIEGELMAALR